MTRPKGSANIDWGNVVKQLRRHPGRWLLPLEMAAVPERTVEVIRRRQRAALRLEGGVIRVRVKAAIEHEGKITCTLALKYEPTTREEPHGSQADPAPRQRASEGKGVR